MSERHSLENILTKRSKIAALAGIEPKQVLSTLSHHIDYDWLCEAHRRTRKDGAVGVDGVDAKKYAKQLDENLLDLLSRFKSGTYRAPAVKRIHIDKGDGRSTRPLGIPSFEDKILQRAVVMVLEPIYEQDFLSCSYGFRPKRSAHDALEAVFKGLMNMNGGWIIDLDIKQFFDHVDRHHLYEMLDQRVRDGVIRRAIGKWLKAGVMENGVMKHPQTGTPQGSVISPLLANIYLHEVLDMWFEDEVKPCLNNKAFMVRYADDAVLCFKQESDARRVMEVLSKRLTKFGLELNESKTQLMKFKPSPRKSKKADGRPTPRAHFDFLGFTHYWQRSKSGQWVVARKTAKGRFGKALERIGDWCRRYRHLPLIEQQKSLSRKLIGHYNYYGIIGNSRSLGRFLYECRRRWFYWLARRSHVGMNWEKFTQLYARYPLAVPRMRSVTRIVT